jgi:two-component system phosphate regulon sensor histidine kinase PhoR
VTAATQPQALRYRLRLVAGFAVIAALFAVAWAWSLFGPLTQAVQDQQREYLAGIARSAALAITDTQQPLDDAVRALAADSELRVTVVAADGGVLADSEEVPASMENHGDRPEVRSALGGRTGFDVRRSDTQGIDRMYVAIPAEYEGTRVAVRVSTSLAHIRDLSSDLRGTSLALLALTVLLSGVAVWRLSGAAAGPVERLAYAARAMADGDLGWSVPEEAGSLRPLSEALGRLGEQMRERIAALEGERQTLRTVIDGLSDAVLFLEGDAVMLANRSLATMFRVPRGPLAGRRVTDLDLPAPLETAILASVDAETPRTTDLGPDPFRRYHRLLVVPLGAEDGARRTLVVVSDVTDRMRLDSIRRNFVANASHELKTPTAGILLLAESAEQAAADGDVSGAMGFVSQISGEAQRLRRLVSDLLDLSRLETAPPPGAVTDLRHAVDLAVAGHRRSASEKGLELTVDTSAVAGRDVGAMADPTDIAVVLDNLLSNAVTYTEHGGITVRLGADDEHVEMAVLDTGIGIPAYDVERVFERFYRVDRARSRTSGGTGLGLSLVRNAVERAGGSVEIESQEGTGTTVTVRLRRAR